MPDAVAAENVWEVVIRSSAAILGGTLAMVGSGLLIVLNDLLRQGGQEPFSLFAVTPIGALLLGAGIAYFLVLGRWILPIRQGEPGDDGSQRTLIDQWQLAGTIHGCSVGSGSDLVGQTLERAGLVNEYGLNLLALRQGGETQEAPWRHTRFAAGQDLALLGREEEFQRFLLAHELSPFTTPEPWLEELQAGGRWGFAGLVVRPRAPRAGATLRQLALRKEFGIEPLVLLSGDGATLGEFSDVSLRPGSALIAHGSWKRLRAPGRDDNFWLLTPIEPEASEPGKSWLALILFALALALAFADFPAPRGTDGGSARTERVGRTCALARVRARRGARH
ncbi:MAG: SLC13 family permease [Polyangiaceae bacterium]|nr:SLC13 family permease [Polyangiaceae bacterium]